MSEADTIWLYSNEGQALAGRALAYDYETGFGLVQALGRFNVPPLPIGSAAELGVGEPVIVAGARGGRPPASAPGGGGGGVAGDLGYFFGGGGFPPPPPPHLGGGGR